MSQCQIHGYYNTGAMGGGCPACGQQSYMGGAGGMSQQQVPIVHSNPALEAAINNLSGVIEQALKEMGYKKEGSPGTSTETRKQEEK